MVIGVFVLFCFLVGCEKTRYSKVTGSWELQNIRIAPIGEESLSIDLPGLIELNITPAEKFTYCVKTDSTQFILWGDVHQSPTSRHFWFSIHPDTNLNCLPTRVALANTYVPLPLSEFPDSCVVSDTVEIAFKLEMIKKDELELAYSHPELLLEESSRGTNVFATFSRK